MSKYDLSLSKPLMNAAGMLGFTPDLHGPVDLDRLGAFVTNPVSLGPRTPAQGRRWLDFPGGFLIHTGYPNPGLNAVLKRYAGSWARSPVPVWVHLIPKQVDETSLMVQQLERVAGVSGVELGLPPDVDGRAAAAFARAAAGELPVVLRLPFERASELAGQLAADLAGSGTAALSLAPPRGSLIDPAGNLLQGRLYGPGMFPLALAAVQTLARSGLAVIAAGGAYRPQDVEAMLSAGAVAVQLDTVLWRGGFMSVLRES